MKTRFNFRPSIKRGDCLGHAKIVLLDGEHHAFSRQGAREIVAGAFSQAEITGPDFLRLIEEIDRCPSLKGCKCLNCADLMVDMARSQSKLHLVQKLVRAYVAPARPEPAIV